MQEVTVKLHERSYPIYVGREMLSSFAEFCKKHHLPHRLAIVVDKNVAHLHLRQLANSLRHHGYEVTEIIIGVGERQKSLSRANAIFAALVNSRFSRDSAILALGGGVVGDVTGFVAATYRRGVPLVQIPTTLLAQVESAIGGKVAVNHPLSKNAIGAFYQPQFVFSDIDLLSTLSPREIICGLGEVLKYAIINEAVFSFLDQHLDNVLRADLDVLQEIVLQCNIIKAKMISEDEKETNPTGGRAILNLGHTIGHALENLSHYKLHHGEAVLVGLQWELEIAVEARLIGKKDFTRIYDLLKRADFKPDLKFLDKKLLLKTIFGKNGKAKFVLPKKIGEVVITQDVEQSLVQAVLKNKKF